MTCTFNNSILRGTIVVEKQTLPDGSPEDFGFTTSYGSPFALTDGMQNETTDLLPTSESDYYWVAEDVEAGWDPTDVTCTSSVAGTEDPAAIELDPGETVHCVFTNTQHGEIQLALELNPPLADLFDFDGELPETLGHGSVVSKVLAAGTYQARLPRARLQTPSWLWLVEGFTCNDSNSIITLDDLVELIADFVLEPGEGVRCTLVLRIPWQYVPVSVNNPLALLLMVLALMAAGWYFRPAAMRK